MSVPSFILWPSNHSLRYNDNSRQWDVANNSFKKGMKNCFEIDASLSCEKFAKKESNNFWTIIFRYHESDKTSV